MILHGKDNCEKTCEQCDGDHHWMLDGIDPDDVDHGDDEVHDAVKMYDKANGTEHLLEFLSCKHCQAWAEIEPGEDLTLYEEDFGEFEDDDDDDTDEFYNEDDET